ncbi:hypothetical protein O181_120053 [Austropuccinia psidii MF-1]|uniref:Uncharacterized protein n=1 Tax=Austropuccinia psidii MF-1 TaxID=1389203 RepID=A0A9Q3PZZ1_9BASI|nr:hypothetical protein [Austropuccinia psidii MF-1]
MPLCICRQCIAYTTQQPNGTLSGRLISELNKQKHQHAELNQSMCKIPTNEDTSTSSSEHSDAPSSESEDHDFKFHPEETLPVLVAVFICWLHLPPELRNKVAFTLLYAIIPGPNAPDIINISNTLKPLVDEFLVIIKGLNVNTYKYPHGQKVVAQLLPLVGDLVAIHKAVGFGSHSETQFCSWCTSELTSLPTLKIGTRRNAVDIFQAAQAWKEAKSLGAQEAIQKSTGV